MLILIAASPCKLQYICSLTVTKDGWYRFRVGTIIFPPSNVIVCTPALIPQSSVCCTHSEWVQVNELLRVCFNFYFISSENETSFQKMQCHSAAKCITIRPPDGQLFRKLEDLEGSRRNTSQIGFHFLYTTELCSFVYTITNPKGNSTLIQFIV